MKRFLFFMALMLSCVVQAFAYDCEVDGIYYNLNMTAKTATVTYGPGVNNTYSGTVIVPGTIEYGLMEYAVTEIGDDAFHECTSLTKVVLPQGLTTIGKSAFPGCVNLVSINIPSTVRTISNYAFCYCNFPSMTIPEGVTTIGSCAFQGAKLSYISLPSTLTTIKDYAFLNCPNLTDIECKALTPPSFTSTSFLNITQDIVLHVPAESAASYSSAWGSVCSAVGGFNDLMKTSPSKCYTLTTPRSSLCVSKTSVTSLKRIASTLDETDPMQQFAFVKSGAEYYMMSVATHEYVSNTGRLVASIEEAQPIYYLDDILYFDEEHVINIRNSEVVYDSYTTKDDGNTYVIKEVGDFDVNAAPVVVRYTAGDVRYQLNTQTHVAGVIGVASDEITEVTVPSTVEYDSEVYNVFSIEYGAFDSNTSITSVDIAEGITMIKGLAFQDCTSITSIALPNSVTYIGEWAFRQTDISSIEIPTGLTYLSQWTFQGCKSLTSVVIPENIDSISVAAFQNCTSLREVTIPSGITSLPSWVFSGCTSLSSVHCNATIPPTISSSTGADGIFNRLPANAVLYVPEESASAYKASAWRTYFSYINCEPITDGYYFITNPTRSANNAVYEDVSVNGTKWGNYTVPSDGNFHASDAKYVWKISANSNGKYTLQNVLTGRFMNKANKIQVAIPTTETATETFSIIPAERTTENEGHWILKNSSTATASDVSGYCSGVHAAVANNYVVQWDPSAPASHWDLIKLSEEDVTALESAMANKGSITFEYTIDGRAWRSQTRLVDDLSEVTVPEQEFVTIVSTSDLTDLHDGDVVTVECEEDLPFPVTTDEEAPIYGIIHGHSNQDRYIYVDDSGNGKDTGSAGDPENVNDNYLWYITGNLIDGFRLHNKAFDGATLKSTATIAKVNGTASDTWELRGAAKGSKFNNQEVFSLYQENVNYLNCQGSLKYWSANDEGSSFYFEPQPTEFVDGTEYTNGTSTKVGLLTYTRNFKNTNWQALYIPFSLDYEEWCDDFDIARVYNFIDYDDNDDGVFDRTYLVVQKKTSGSTEPNYPYLIRAKETGNKTLTLTDKTLEPAESNSIDCSSVDYIYTFTGSYTPVTDMYANGYYALSGGALNKANSASVVLGAQRWYMELTARGGCYTTRAQSIKIVVDGEDETEGIIAPSSSPKGESPVVYDLMGRGVKGAVKGISIVNGKKIIK